ncbi:MAG: ATP-binding cassette domain-containing protein, partial [Nitrososphaerales archaeon]
MDGIQIQNLTKTYEKLVALNDVSLEVRAGEVIGLLGPNGAGKSTLMKIVVGVLRPTSGSVSVGGHDIVKDPEKAKKAVGYLPENPSLYTGLTVSEFLRFVGKIRSVDDATLEARIGGSLKTFS